MKKTDYNAKITEIESKIPSISGLAITAALTAVEYKIPDVSNLVKKKKKTKKKTDYNTKILGTKCKYFTTADYNKFTSQTLDAKIKQKGLVDKSPIAGFLSNAELDNKVAALTKAELKAEQDKIIKLQTFDSSYFRSKSHFEDDGTDNLKKMVILIVFHCGNLKDCLRKVLILLLHLIIVLLRRYIIFVIRQE